MVNFATKIGAISLNNPIMPASGTFSEDLACVFDLELLGAHVTKSIFRGSRGGNPTPRAAEVQNGMLNSIGIPSKGIDHFKAKVLPFYERYETPLVVSVSADTIDEFALICEEISVPGVSAIEVNISCPNIEEDGKAFAMRPSSTYSVLSKMSQVTDLPLWAKLTPNTGNISEIAIAAEEGGAASLVVANTILAMSIDIRTFRPTLGMIMGGLSGPAIKPIIVRMVYQCSKAVDIPVIGCGGISNAQDIIEYLVAGATAVQVGTATFINPTAMPNMLQELRSYCDEQGYENLSDIVGQIKDGEDSVDKIFMEATAS